MTGAGTAELRLRAAVVTVSTSRASEGGSDDSGDALSELVAGQGGMVVARETVADDRLAIEEILTGLADSGACDLILTTGGTGLTASDVTPEATEAVLEKRAPGIAEAMRAASAPHTPHWMLSRGTAGVRGACLIVNFPGNPKAIAETGKPIFAALPHAVALLRDETAAGHR